MKLSFRFTDFAPSAKADHMLYYIATHIDLGHCFNDSLRMIPNETRLTREGAIRYPSMVLVLDFSQDSNRLLGEITPISVKPAF
jgi:hypothetical protein